MTITAPGTPKVHIFDTTLRDGEQSAGVAFSVRDKIDIADALERLGVDVIEAGFPCATPGDFEGVRAVARRVRGATVCALARAVPADIDRAWEALRDAESPRLHVFINTSDIQMAHQLRKAREEVLDQAAAMVRYARSRCADVEFSPMDATRADPSFLTAIVAAAVTAGATVINVPDSVGYALPHEIEHTFRSLRAAVPALDDDVRLSFHGQDDLGLCTANSLAAVRAGARQIEATINGIGERAGNTALEEVVMAIKTRADVLGVHTDVRTTELYTASRLVSERSDMAVQSNKAIVGLNAFRHGSGIHQDGILKLRETWEIMDPSDIGVPRGTQIVLGKLSGRHAFRRHLEDLVGAPVDTEALTRAFAAFKTLADQKAEVDDATLRAIATAAGHGPPGASVGDGASARPS